MQNRHSPSPWYHEPKDDGFKVIGPARREIAEVLPDEDGHCEPNARLIAASPELLQALKVCIATMKLINAEAMKQQIDEALKTLAIAEANYPGDKS